MVDPLEWMRPEFVAELNAGKIDTNSNNFIEGAIAATLTTIDQGTEEVFGWGLGKKSGWYKYHRFKAAGITSLIDYNLNLQEQRTNYPDCDERVNAVVAGVQTAFGNGLASIGAVAGSLGGPFGAFAGAATASTTYSIYGNKHLGEVVRPMVQYLINFYDRRKE